MRLDENWIRAHLPENVAGQPIDCFAGAYLDGLTVMHESERGGDDVAVYRAKKPHWDYDRKKLCFIEISDSKEHDGDGLEEPRPGSVIRITD